LFLNITRTAKYGAKITISSHIKQIMGKKIKIILLSIIGEYLDPEKKIEIINNKNNNKSFLPKTSISAIGYNKKIGENSANN
jgi:hypothetical protein